MTLTGRNNPKRNNDNGARVKRYHGQASSHTFPPSVKPTPDARDPWRLALATDPALRSGTLRLGLVLLNYANRDGFTSVGVARLVADLGKNRRTVERHLATLAAAGYLGREPGGGVRGNGGMTCGTWLKVPASSAAKVPADPTPPWPKVPAETRKGTGGNAPKVPVPGGRSNPLNPLTHAADAPGLEAGSATAEHKAGGQVLEVLGELVAADRSGPRPVRDVVLAAIRQKLGAQPKAPVSDDENSRRAGGRGG